MLFLLLLLPHGSGARVLIHLDSHVTPILGLSHFGQTPATNSNNGEFGSSTTKYTNAGTQS